LAFGFFQRAEFAYLSPGSTIAGIDPQVDPRGHAKEARLSQINQRFEQAVAMLHAKQYDFAVKALHKVLELSPNLVDAHVNMGYALLGLKNYKAAGDFFANAIRLDSYKGNAYWGLAIALDGLGDKQAALGAMRTYIHLAPAGDPFVTKARSALWEWEDELRRGPRPKEEADWLQRKGEEWTERNSPELDKPAGSSRPVDLLGTAASTHDLK
jgi:tetratricopeptide (TPR) repeat protein